MLMKKEIIGSRALLSIVLIALLLLVRTSYAGTATVIIQPDETVSEDSYIDQANANTNFGTAVTLLADRSTGAVKRPILRFDLSTIPSNVTGASLNLNVTINVNTVTYGAHRVTSDWTESGVTWNSRNGTVNWTTAGGDFNATAESSISIASAGLKTWMITSLTQGWINGTYSNYGVIIKESATGGTRLKTIASSNDATSYLRPYLTVNYTDYVAPTIQFVSPSETSGTFINRGNIIINATAVDINLANITVRLYNSSGSLINSTTTTTSPNFVNITGLANGVYFFNASATDYAANTNSTATSNVTIDTINPSLTINSPFNNTLLNSRTISINLTATDLNLNYTNISITNSSGSIINSTTSTTNGTYVIQLGVPSDGVYNITATSYDKAGNTNISTAGNITIAVPVPYITTDLGSYSVCDIVFYKIFVYDSNDNLIDANLSIDIYNTSAALQNTANATTGNGGTGIYLGNYTLSTSVDFGKWLIDAIADSLIKAVQNFFVGTTPATWKIDIDFMPDSIIYNNGTLITMNFTVWTMEGVRQTGLLPGGIQVFIDSSNVTSSLAASGEGYTYFYTASTGSHLVNVTSGGVASIRGFNVR